MAYMLRKKTKNSLLLLMCGAFLIGCKKLNQAGHSFYLESRNAFQQIENIVLSPVRATDDFIEEEITGPPLDPNQGTFEGWKKIY